MPANSYSITDGNYMTEEEKIQKLIKVIIAYCKGDLAVQESREPQILERAISLAIHKLLRHLKAKNKDLEF